MSRRLPRGFTLIEIAIALAIMAVIAAMGLGALSRLKDRGNFASATGDLITTVFVIDTVGARFWGIEDVNGAFDITTFNASNPAPAGFNLLVSGTLPNGVTFNGATNGYGAALPQPYVGVPSYSGSSPAPNFAYCSFCRTTTPNLGFGAISFDTSGGARFNAGPAAVGQSFSVVGQSQGATGAQTVMTYAVVGPTGTADTFQNPP